MWSWLREYWFLVWAFLHTCNSYTWHWDLGVEIVLRIQSQVLTVLLPLNLVCLYCVTLIQFCSGKALYYADA